MKNGYLVGMIAGAIAGFADGIVSNLSAQLGGILGLWEPVAGQVTWTIMFVLAYLFVMVEYNVLWGAVFGLAYVIVYDSIPGKGIKKGLIFSLLFYFVLADVRTAQILWSGRAFSEGIIFFVKAFVFVGFFAFIVYGIVLGYLYKK